MAQLKFEGGDRVRVIERNNFQGHIGTVRMVIGTEGPQMYEVRLDGVLETKLFLGSEMEKISDEI